MKNGLVLVLFALLLLPCIAFAADREYVLTDADISVNLAADGKISINEQISYRFSGCFSEVYRDTDIYEPAAGEETSSLKKPFISSISASCDPKCNAINRGYEIVGNFGTICNRDAKFNINMEVLKGIIIGKDIAELHYKVWGEKWTEPLANLDGQIILPEGISRNNADVFFNPLGVVSEYNFEGNALNFTAKNLNGYLEVRLLMPKEFFETNNNFIFDDTVTRQGRINIQNFYARMYSALSVGLPIISILFICVLIWFAVGIYNKYGTEPKISYSAVFEREAVKGLKPYVISKLCGKYMQTANPNAITATLLDLIRRKHLKLEQGEMKKKLFGNADREIMLYFIGNPEDKLSKAEEVLYSYFRGFADSKGKLVWSEFLAKLKKQSNAQAYTTFAKQFDTAVSIEYNDKNLFENEGTSKIRGFGITVLVAGIILVMAILNSKAAFLSAYPQARTYPIFVGFAMLVGGIVCFALPDRIFGRYTPEGYLAYLKSINFKKFMTDMTLLKRYPPASIIIWEEMLVYATVFGVADKVISEMKIMVSEKSLHTSGMYLIVYGNAFAFLNSASSVVHSAMNHSHSGGFGGGSIGGGFGGGGGGAR